MKWDLATGALAWENPSQRVWVNPIYLEASTAAASRLRTPGIPDLALRLRGVGDEEILRWCREDDYRRRWKDVTGTAMLYPRGRWDHTIWVGQTGYDRHREWIKEWNARNAPWRIEPMQLIPEDIKPPAGLLNYNNNQGRESWTRNYRQQWRSR